MSTQKSSSSARTGDTTGARWVRAALQANPYGYKGKNETAKDFASEPDYNKALLDECRSTGV